MADCSVGAAGLKFLLAPEPAEDLTLNENKSSDFPFLKFAEDVIRSDGFQKSSNKLAYLREHLGISFENICKLADKTSKQATDPVWIRAHMCRLTSSNFGKIFQNIESNRKNVTLLRDLLNPRNLDGIKAVMWGRTHEPTAKEAFTKEMGLFIKKTGIWLHESGLLGASPDGFVGDDAVLECKCPYSLRNKNLHVVLDISKPDAVKD